MVRITIVAVFLFDIFLSTLLYPVLLVFLAPVLFYRWSVIIVAKLFYPTLIPGTPLDQIVGYDSFYAARTRRPMIFNSGTLTRLKGTISVASFRNSLKNLLGRTNSAGEPQLSKLACSAVSFGGYLFFRPIPALNFGDVIREVKLEANQSLHELKIRFCNAPFRVGCPLWEIGILKDGEESVVIFRIHHSIVDGYSQAYLGSLLFGNPPKIEAVERAPVPFLEIARSFIKAPRMTFLVTLRTFQSRRGIPVDTSSDTTFSTSIQISYLDLKAVLRKTRASITAVNLHLFASVLPQIVGRGYGDRTTIGFALPWPNHPTTFGQIGNHFAGVSFCIPLRDMDALKRLNEIDQNLESCKTEERDKFMFWMMMPLLGILPLDMLRCILSQSHAICGIRAVTSVLLPGTSSGATLEGLPVISTEQMIGRCNYHNAFAEQMLIGDGTCTITMSASSTLVPSQEKLEQFMEFFKIELQNLLVRLRNDETV